MAVSKVGIQNLSSALGFLHVYRLGFSIKANIRIISSLSSKCVQSYTLRQYCKSASGDSDGDRDKKGLKSRTDSTIKPGQAFEDRKKAQYAAKKERATPSLDKQGLDPKLVSAVDEVAKSLGADQSKTKSDLLEKLQQHTTEKPKTSTSVRSLLAGMRVEKPLAPHIAGSGQSVFEQQQSAFGKGRQVSSLDEEDQGQQWTRKKQDPGEYKLFDGQALGIFPAKCAVTDRRQGSSVSTLFDALEQEELDRLMSVSPDNRFEEIIQWTKEGKLWKFPIDNEQGLDEEMKVGFHEHVFIEQEIDNRFPARGPIRQFMELVAVGLSMNPYFTVGEKRAHIDWYADYFKDKIHLAVEHQEVTPSGEQTEIKTAEQHP